MSTTILLLKDYLARTNAFEFSDNTIQAIFSVRGIEDNATTVSTTIKQRELCQADLYMYMVGLPTTQQSSLNMGDWSKTEGGITINPTDRKRYKQFADAIYKKYGEMDSGIKDRTNFW